MLKVYAIKWDGNKAITAYYAAQTAARAKYLCYLSVAELYDNVNITQFSARRAPLMDGLAIGEGSIDSYAINISEDISDE